jgi:hypothetical protein
MSGFNFAIGDTVEIPWRPERPVKVDDRMYEAVTPGPRTWCGNVCFMGF